MESSELSLGTSAAAELLVSEIGELEAELSGVAADIWEHPEIALCERHSSAAQQRLAEAHGFELDRGLGGLETAFLATITSGDGQGPSIAFLGEFDALPGLSQDRVPYRSPLVEGGPGHGCGHNLLGTAALGAALALRRAVERQRIPARIAYVGCPAEETVIGKVVMARAGVFDGFDVALSWHPGDFNTVWAGSTTALDDIRFRFAGRSAHAAHAHQGRSALDAVELMNVAVNYLREHVTDDVRLHYAITHCGQAPNIVPEFAESVHRVRAATREKVALVRERLVDCARGAALMTGTSASWETVGACYELLPNRPLEALLLESLRAVGPPGFDDDDRAFAQELLTSLSADERRQLLKKAKVPEELLGAELHERVDAPFEPEPFEHFSTDIGDVSWILPTGQLFTACVPVGTPAHSWQFTASVGSGIGRKGMLTASKALSTAGLALVTNPELLESARADFDERRHRKRYSSPLPEDFALDQRYLS